MAFEISRVDRAAAPEQVLRELAAYYDVMDAEDLPDDPPTPAESRIARWRNPTKDYAENVWVLREDGEIRGLALAGYDLEQNLQNGEGQIHVRPEHRGRGFARALATPMFDDLEENGRVRFATGVKDARPAEALVTRLGLKAVYHEKRSRLLIADLDMDLMESWISRAAERAGDYELRYVALPLPDEIVEPYCELWGVMNTAPREDYQTEDEVLTPEVWRDYERSLLNQKRQLHNLIAVHSPTGEFAGFTQINTQDLQPDLAWQWNTGVHPEHRNKGLGRWLKAEMIRRIVDEYPNVTRIDTWNAGSNEPMLNINVEMGYKPIFLSTIWQGELATVRERFGA
jgi:GNAT superfamily N-acetyltransferase